MSFITRHQLTREVSNKSNIISEHLIQQKICAGIYAKVFLSHSHYDKDLIEDAILLFKKIGAGLYIDHKDSNMPEVTNSETAKILKDKIVKCGRFVMLASDTAKASRWVPWELGYADGSKFSWELAILPVQSSAIGWEGNEYVGLYSTIQMNYSGDWFVVEPGANIDSRLFSQPLEKWLRVKG